MVSSRDKKGAKKAPKSFSSKVKSSAPKAETKPAPKPAPKAAAPKPAPTPAPKAAAPKPAPKPVSPRPAITAVGGSKEKVEQCEALIEWMKEQGIGGEELRYAYKGFQKANSTYKLNKSRFPHLFTDEK